MDNSKTHGFLKFFFLFLAQTSFAHQLDAIPEHAFYLTTGYSLTHELYHGQEETVTNISPTVTYIIRNSYPNNFNGIRFGFGGRLGPKGSPFGYEFDFNQVFAKNKITPGLNVTRAEKIVLGFVDYTINPKSKLQWIVAGGGVITTVPLTVETIAPNQVSISTSSSTSVDPAIAGVALYHINSSVALKGVFIYKIAPYDTSIRGTLIPLLMINYYPPIFN